ncbi:MAG: hypothetical protein KBA26_12755 [Candidatus Delongbacteria bacterium]|nr:hypothetical protein [Candidatus Delongbacteria bacterium]
MKKYRLMIGLLILVQMVIVNLSQASEVKELRIGNLQNWFMASGSEPEEAFVAVQQTGFEWPAFYDDQDCQAAKGLWICATNFDDPVVNRTFPYKVVHCGPRVWFDENEFMPIEFKMHGRFEKPIILVDDNPASALTFSDKVDVPDPNLPCDRMLYNVVNTSIGVTMTRKIYAFGENSIDDFYINEYIFKNTGIYDSKGSIKEQTLTGVYFYWQYRWAVASEGCNVSKWGMQNSTRWGLNNMIDVVRVKDEAKDSMRCQISWHGKHSGHAWDNLGSPHFKGTYPDGRLGAAQFIGVTTIHADKSASDKSDDKLQPTSTYWTGSDDNVNRSNDQYNENKMTAEYEQVIKGHCDPTQAEVVGDGYADQYSGAGSGGISQAQGFGPYTLAPGDSIRIVFAEAAGGLSREMCELVGGKWFREEGPYTLPDGGTASNKDAYKNAWVYTGRDSLMKTFRRAMQVWKSELNVPQAPPAPTSFEIISGGNRINLIWSDNAETHPGFNGYEVYRAIGKYDTTYQLLFKCGKSDVVHEFNDMTAERGKSYFYYIQSVDDGSTNIFEPGTPLKSSLFLTRTIEAAYLRRPAAEDWKTSLRVVPNPFNIRNETLQYPKETNKLMFLNLPEECTIKIFTERGDLIETLHHTTGSGDKEWWNITSSRQIVVSGIYIAHFETPSGESTFRKFIIIR